jgi:CRISPR/Cas system CMR-associated protein Cmr3 (group 5 of RAMP superfamily)
MARPKKNKEDKQEYRITIYLSKKEKDNIENLCNKTFFSISDYCKRAILENKEKILDRESLNYYRLSVYHLTMIGKNVNQIATAMNAMSQITNPKGLNAGQKENLKETLSLVNEFLTLWDSNKSNVFKI